MSRTDDTARPHCRVSSDTGAGEEVKEKTYPSPSSTNHGTPLRDDASTRTTRQPPSKLLRPEDTIELARGAVENGLQETKRSLAGSEAVGDVVRPKLTIDLGHKNIGWVPEEIVGIIKNEVARLSLSNNYIDHIPNQFSECVHLRYLNIRANNFIEFPDGVFNLNFLEILDLSRNKITKIPEEVKNLTSLRVLSVVQNLLEDLPSELSDMNKLQVLKVSGNSLNSPLKRILDMKDSDITAMEMTDNEKDSAITTEIKRFLKRRQPTPANTESINEMSDDILGTPKPPKRGNRFPVVVRTNGSDSSQGSRSLSLSRPPPIPSRSHHRIPSGNGSSIVNGINRPGTSPKPGGNERNRSNSEGFIHGPASSRSRRVGVAGRKNTDLVTLDEVRPYRNSHLRGLSHGSLLRSQHGDNTNGSTFSSPSSPKERRRLRDGFLRRLSSLPEHKAKSKAKIPIIEAATGVLYSIFQVHPHISSLIDVIKAEEHRRSSLEIVFYHASIHIDQLNDALENAERVDMQDTVAAKRASDAVKRESETCIMAYTHVCTQLRNSAAKMLSRADPKYVRSLLLTMYGSLVELRNAHLAIRVNMKDNKPYHATTQSISDTARKIIPNRTGEPSQTPNKERYQPVRRLRSDTTIHHQIPTSIPSNASSSNPIPFATFPNQPHSTPLSYDSRSRSSSRSNTLMTSSIPSSFASTPRSGESFGTLSSSTVSRINPMTGLDEYDEERIFEKIFVQLSTAYQAALQAVPVAARQFSQCLELAKETKAPEYLQNLLSKLITRCHTCIDVSEALHLRLTNMKLKEPGGGMRNQREFWQLCKTFMQSFVELVMDMREAKSLRVLPPDIVVILRPVQKANKDAGRLIDASPWSYLAELNTSNPSYPPHLQPHHVQNYPGSSASSMTNGSMTSLACGPSPQSLAMPATPLSAALGPAAQATVPSAPVSASSDRFFAGDVFQRADSLLSMSGPPAPLFYRR